jgi:hypothetical protein
MGLIQRKRKSSGYKYLSNSERHLYGMLVLVLGHFCVRFFVHTVCLRLFNAVCKELAQKSPVALFYNVLFYLRYLFCFLIYVYAFGL